MFKQLFKTSPLQSFSKLIWSWAINQGMKAQAKDVLLMGDWASPDANASLGKTIVEDAHFNLKLQPKIDLQTQKICGFEAFASPELNGVQIHPQLFVPSIELSSQHKAFDWIVLNKGFEWVKNNNITEATPVSFNVHPITLSEKGFSDQLEQLAQQYSIPLKAIKIEILEKMNISDDDRRQLEIELKKAHQKGFEFSIDDFGSGDADCSMFNLPATELKIDAYYIKRLDNKKVKKWVQSMVSFARHEGLKVCAEGVEEKWQADILKELGIDIGQGYLWSRPVSAEDAAKMIQENSEDLAVQIHRSLLNHLKTKTKNVSIERSNDYGYPLPSPG